MTTQAVPPPFPNPPGQQCYPRARNHFLSLVDLVWVANTMYVPECICTCTLIKSAHGIAFMENAKTYHGFYFFQRFTQLYGRICWSRMWPSLKHDSCLLFWTGPPPAFPGFLCLIHPYFQGRKQSHIWDPVATVTREKGREASNPTWPLLTGRELTCWAASAGSLAWFVPNEKGIYACTEPGLAWSPGHEREPISGAA